VQSVTEKPILIGTWASALWAVSFYQWNGYTLVSEEEKNRLLRRYWSIPERLPRGGNNGNDQGRALEIILEFANKSVINLKIR
jgi:hypothetical protein